LLVAPAGAVKIKLPQKLHDRQEAPPNEHAPPREILKMRDVLVRALEHAHTRAADLRALPLIFSGTAFQERVWRAIAEVEPGKIITYGALAKELENPGAARAVGAACGANPFALLIPCHRVVATTGLGGFSGDPAIKSALLAMEAEARGVSLK
jgi:O-6-methylguanine DNA methyltransferase